MCTPRAALQQAPRYIRLILSQRRRRREERRCRDERFRRLHHSAPTEALPVSHKDITTLAVGDTAILTENDSNDSKITV